MKSKFDIGRKIKNKRLTLNLTSSVVAKKAGITRATLSVIENGSTKCSLTNLIKVLKVLDMNLIVESGSNIKATRKRATRSITKKMKDINSFIVMCVEEYASEVNKPSEIVYKEMKKYGLIKYLEEFYEEMHAMSFQYINQEIDEVLKNKRYLY